MSKLTERKRSLIERMSKYELRKEIRCLNRRLGYYGKQYNRILSELNYMRNWNIRIIDAMSVAHAKRGLAAYIVIYIERNGKERRKLFLTQRHANRFRDSLIPSRSHSIRVEPLYFT